jgi:hypothetical protein
MVSRRKCHIKSIIGISANRVRQAHPTTSCKPRTASESVAILRIIIMWLHYPLGGHKSTAAQVVENDRKQPVKVPEVNNIKMIPSCKER